MSTACAAPLPSVVKANCGPVPELIMSADVAWPGSLRQDGADLAALRENFAEGFVEACAKGIIPATGPVDREGKPFDSIEVVHNPDANQLFIGRGADQFAGTMYLQEAFFTDDGLVRVPTPDDFVYEFICVMRPPSAEERERTGDCMYD